MGPNRLQVWGRIRMTTAQRYQHRVVVTTGTQGDVEFQMDEASEEGWEVVSLAAVPTRSGGDYDWVYVLRRPA
jgi:predicted GTPase